MRPPTAAFPYPPPTALADGNSAPQPPSTLSRTCTPAPPPRRARPGGHGDKIYIVTEFLRGGSLARELDGHESGLPEPDARAAFRALLDGVAYLHSRGVIHRDLKARPPGHPRGCPSAGPPLPRAPAAQGRALPFAPQPPAGCSRRPDARVTRRPPAQTPGQLENLILATPGDFGSLRIIDFGLARASFQKLAPASAPAPTRRRRPAAPPQPMPLRPARVARRNRESLRFARPQTPLPKQQASARG